MNLKKLMLVACLVMLPCLLMAQIIIRPNNCVRATSTYTPNPNVSGNLFSMTLGSSTQNFTFNGDQKDFCGLGLPMSSFVLRFRYMTGLPIDMAVIDFASIDALAVGDVLSVPSGGCTTFRITKLGAFSVVGSTYYYNLYIYPYYPC